MSSFVGGIITQLIFRRPFGSFFHFNPDEVAQTLYPIHGLQAIFLGFVGALVALVFICFTKLYIKIKAFLKITPESKIQPYLPLFAWAVFSAGGMFLPPILFWGEPDFQNILSLNQTPLPHWQGPTSGIFPLPSTYNAGTVFLIGIVKLMILPFNMAMNLKGGIVFPLFHIGGTFGQFIHLITGFDQAVCICAVMAAGQGAITRTPLASALVASFNSTGAPPQIIIPAVIASYTSTLLNYKLGIFPSQRPRDGKFQKSKKQQPQTTNNKQQKQKTNNKTKKKHDQKIRCVQRLREFH